MAYEPTEWVCGDTVTADKLNKLERGIQEIMSDYVPTNWQCGDVITAEKLNKLEQAVADFECGSSDFSTAQMTISGFPSGFDGGVKIGGFAEIEDGALMFISDINSFPNGTYVVVLYQGTTQVTCFDSITVSGDAEYDGEEIITATGDFTISPLS